MKEQEENKDCGCSHETVKMEHGGMFVGPSHDGGGIPLVVQDTGQQVEVEGKEPLIPREVIEDEEVRTRRGKNIEIVNQILKKAGLSTKNKATVVKGGDVVICKRAVHDDDTVREITGTDSQIISAVNESGGCKVIDAGAEVVEMKDGGSIFKYYWRYRNKGTSEEEFLKTKHLSKPGIFNFIADNQERLDSAILYDGATKKIAATFLQGQLNLISEELKPALPDLTYNSREGYSYHGLQKQTAEKVGLVTLPKKITGTNCTNCIFYKNNFCDNKEILLPVNSRMCCAFWDEKTPLSALNNLENADFFPEKTNEKYKLNSQGGYIYSGVENARAKEADLITLPLDIKGTNCAHGNCKFTDANFFCMHPKIQLHVNKRMSCALWDNNQVKRPWGEMQENFFSLGGFIKSKNSQGKQPLYDHEGRPRFKIHDSVSEINYEYIYKIVQKIEEVHGGGEVFLFEIFTWWDGYNYYPKLKTLGVIFLWDPKDERPAFYSLETQKININVHKLIQDYETNTRTTRQARRGLSTFSRRTAENQTNFEQPRFTQICELACTRIFHELQHALQHRDGIFSALTGQESFVLQYLRSKYDQYSLSDEELKQFIAQKHGLRAGLAYTLEYRNIPGEKEASNAEEEVRRYYYESKPIKYRYDLEQNQREAIFNEVIQKGKESGFAALFQDTEEEIIKRKVLEQLLIEELVEKKARSPLFSYYYPTKKLYKLLGIITDPFMKEGDKIQIPNKKRVKTVDKNGNFLGYYYY